MTKQKASVHVDGDEVERLRRRLGPFDGRQVAVWRQMSTARRLDLVGQMYRFALETVRTTERRQHPDLSAEELRWHVIRRIHGDLSLGKVGESKLSERDG